MTTTHEVKPSAVSAAPADPRGEKHSRPGWSAMVGSMVVSMAAMAVWRHAGFSLALLAAVGGAVVGFVGFEKVRSGSGYGWQSAARDAWCGALMGAGMHVGMWLGGQAAEKVKVQLTGAKQAFRWGGMLAGMAAAMWLSPHQQPRGGRRAPTDT